MSSAKLLVLFLAWPLVVQSHDQGVRDDEDCWGGPGLPSRLVSPRVLSDLEGSDRLDRRGPESWTSIWRTLTSLTVSTVLSNPATALSLGISPLKITPTIPSLSLFTLSSSSVPTVVTVTVSVTATPSSSLSLLWPSGYTTPASANRSESSSSSTRSHSQTTAMTTETTSSSASFTSSVSSSTPTGGSDSASGLGSDRTLVITLSTVLSVVGFVLIVGTLWVCVRCRQRRRFPFFARGISPIDDDEIATWKMGRGEKAMLDGVEEPPTSAGSEAFQQYSMTGARRGSAAMASASMGAGARAGAAVGAAAGTAAGTRPSASSGSPPQHGKHSSTGSIKKPPSVIIYSNPGGQGRRSSDGSPRNFSHNSTQPSPGMYGGRLSLDKELPQTPIQARAPNSRAGLTDETVPGDDPFLPSPKRHPSRLSKLPPNVSSRGAPHSAYSHSHHHARTRSSRSSLRSFAEYGWAGSDAELSPRASHEHIRTSHSSQQRPFGHSRVYSTSSIPPRVSLGDDHVAAGLSPRPWYKEDEIGRAIG